MRRSMTILPVLILRSKVPWCPKRQYVPNNIMILNNYGEKTLDVQIPAVKLLEAVMSGVFTMPNGNRK